MVRKRLRRLQSLGHCDVVPTLPQLLVASCDQLSYSLGADTKSFYQSQGIPWTFHNIRRFLAYPTTMMDPVGLFSSQNTIIQHVLQTFHRHATYDLVLLRSHPEGLREIQKQLDDLAQGRHLHQRSLDSLIEDGSYHDRLRQDVAEFIATPTLEARPIPVGLVDNAYLMLAMDQFKDIRGYTNYASRLTVNWFDVVKAFAQMAVNETLGEGLGFLIGSDHLQIHACDPHLVDRHLSSLESTSSRITASS